MQYWVSWLLIPLGLASALCGCSSRESEDVSPGCYGRAIRPDELPASLRLDPLPKEQRPVFADDVRMREVGGESRPALPGVRPGDAFRRLDLELPRDARAPFRRRIDLAGGRYQRAEQVLIAPRIHTAEWQSLRPVYATIERDAEGRYAMLELNLSPFSTHRGSAKIIATVYVVPDSRRVLHETAPLELPTRSAWLAFALGIPEAARPLGPIRFELSACRGEQCRCLHQEVVDPATENGREWQERRLPLEGLEGQGVRLRFTSEAIGPEPTSVSLGQWTRPRLLKEGGARGAGERNLLLISLDTLAARHIEAYGYGRRTSPFMSGELARRGVLFEQGVAASTTTAPSHMTLFTSLPPSVHTVASNLRDSGLPEGVPTLASTLRDAGYATGSINENGALSRRTGFGRGFDFYLERTGATFMHPEGFVKEVFTSGLRFMERHRGERFFLFLHTYEVHDPYTPPPAYARLFEEADDPGHPDNIEIGARRAKLFPVHYDREIRHVDDALRELFSRMETAGLLENTLVVVTSDHGEAFLEHGLMGHGSDVYQEAVHIPLFMMGPGVPEGLRIRAPVGLIDVMPTTLDWLNVSPPADLMGQSFAPLLRGEDSQQRFMNRVLVSEAWHPWGGAKGKRADIEAPVIAVRRGEYKLIRTKWSDGPRYEFYDLSKDPVEAQDRYDPADPRVAELQRLADAYEEASARIVRARGFPPLIAERATLEDVAPDRREALKALGYIE